MSTLDVKECGSSEVHQVSAGTLQSVGSYSQEGRVMAARTRHSVFVLSALIGEASEWSLHSHGRSESSSAMLTDVVVNPHSYPEVMFACDNGSIGVIDLERALDKPHTNNCLLDHVLVREASASSEASCRTVCEYGMTPRQLFCGMNKEIKLCDMRSGLHTSCHLYANLN